MFARKGYLIVLLLVFGCTGPIEERDYEGSITRGLPALAFHLLKSDEPEHLGGIVMSQGDFAELMRRQAQARGLALDENKIQIRSADLAERALRKAKSRLESLRKELDARKFDWTAARLVGVSVKRVGLSRKRVEYDASSTYPHVDIYLAIESKGQSIVVKLDDCFYVNGHRRLADGFVMENDP
ncbi:hypothetical protein LCGC14_1862150 [marine sediment metagenome]|uniref:Uncharacterized protein n=1 Tax=marine sediment metagenome TaxID=412755 RepID=A0A0F9G7K1_9ZZZZ